MKPFTPLIKDNFFRDDELDLIWSELTLLSQPGILREPEGSGTATEDGEVLKRNRGLFLNEFYMDLTVSPLYRSCSRVFEGVTEEYSELGFAESFVLSTRKSNLLVQYYEDSDNYRLHKDLSITTVLYWFCKAPQSFEGGDLYFEDLDETIPFKSNRMVMFPSWARHAVTPVRMAKQDEPLMGRFSVTHFLTF